MGKEDPFEFFRQHLSQSQKTNISIEEERRNRSCKTEYPFFTFAPLTLGILTSIFTLFLFLGIYSGMQGAIFSLGKLLEEYSGVVLIVNALALLTGLFGLLVSNKKKYPIAALVLGVVVSMPLTAEYYLYIRPPVISQEKAITIAYRNVPASIAESVPLTVRWNRRSGVYGVWEMEFNDVNITPDELGWVSDPSGSPNVILNPVGDSGIPESTFKTLRINIDGRTGQVMSKIAAASQNPSSTGLPPRTIISPKLR